MPVRKVVQKIIQSILTSALFVMNPVYADQPYADFDSWAVAQMKSSHVSGVSLAVIDHGQIVYAKTYSTLPGMNANVDSYFQASDLTKTVLTIPMLQLAREKKLSLTNRLRDYDVRSSMTLQDFLTQDDHYQARYTFMRALQPALPSLANIMKTKPVKIENLNYPVDRLKPVSKITQDPQKVMQDVLQAVTQRPLEQYMNSILFIPLKMTRTRMMMQTPTSIDALKLENDANAVISSGGMWTTATDFSKFLLTVMRSSELRASLDDLARKGYSLGFDKDRCRTGIAHYQKVTQSAAVNNYFIYFPETSQGIVILTNSNRAGKLLNNISAEIATQYHWPFKPTITDDDDQRGALPYCKESFFTVKPTMTLPVISHDESAQVEPAVTTTPVVAKVAEAVRTEPVIAKPAPPSITPTDLKFCDQKVATTCHNKSGLGFHHCAMTTLINTPGCSLVQRIMKETGGMPIAMSHYQNAEVIKIADNSAQNELEYFILTHTAELIPLTQSVTSDDNPLYAKLHKAHPRLMLLPISDGFPSEQHLVNGHTRLIFPQRLTDGCYECTAIAHAWVGYEFDTDGKLVGTGLVNVG